MAAFIEVFAVIDRAKEFCYVLSPWIGKRVAKEIRRCGHSKVLIIVIADYSQVNVEAYSYLKDLTVLIDGDMHEKLIITENEYVSGSQNYTERGFFRTHGSYKFYPNTQEDYNEQLDLASNWIKRSKPFDTAHPVEYWTNKDRPVETLPEYLTEPGEPTEVEEPLPPEDNEESEEPELIVLEKDRQAAHDNLDEAFRLLLGKDKRQKK
jgi:hypothetical protein